MTIVLQLAAALVLFLLVEGLASSMFAAAGVLDAQPLAERFHTDFDDRLGWINKPGYENADFYGPKRSMRINEQGFRGDERFAADVPEGRMRVICSGDSFTLGYGVANQDTWCAQLANLDPRLQVVNMGQGGYGVDQAYLWYQQVQDELEHDVHVFAFITDDFWRMQHRHFYGYAKPLLAVGDDAPQPINTPLEQASSFRLWMQRSGAGLRRLASVRLSRRLLGWDESPSSWGAPEDVDAYQLTSAVFDHLSRQHQQHDRTFLLVHLPTQMDCLQDQRSRGWQQWLRQESAAKGWHYLDLVDHFQHLPARDIQDLYLQVGDVDFPSAAGHFNSQGNRLVAELVFAELHRLGVTGPQDNERNEVSRRQAAADERNQP